MTPLDHFRRDVLRGLSAPIRNVPSKYLYDDAGCALFERICELPGYDLARNELAILEAAGAELARLAGPDCRVVEFGSGSGRKSRTLLTALRSPASYLPVDVAAAALAMTREALSDLAGRLAIVPIQADFTGDFVLPATPGDRTIAFFPGSTIGNLQPPQAAAFLARTAKIVGPGGALVVGVDLRKPIADLRAAYDDHEGVTAAFNRNLLVRMNRELGADFELDAFSHALAWDEPTGRLEMRLLTTRPTRARVAGQRFDFSPGEHIHTEDCWKYDLPTFQALARRGGFAVRATWTDPRDRFSVHFLEVQR